MKQKLIFSNLVGEITDGLVAQAGNPRVIIVVDSNTGKLVLPRLASSSKSASSADIICIEAGDSNKNLGALTEIWQRLSDLEATRKDLLINLGGGMVCDIGGFAAATFKRGMRCINIPTTLLAAVDASVGGKTGINFNGLKNQIGTFSEPLAAIISTIYFDTLPEKELLSGYAEMLKHGLLQSRETLGRMLATTPEEISADSSKLLGLLEESVMVKSHIVEQDLNEGGIRKALNLGHTVGHAFEAYSLRKGKPMPHGYAVARGLVTELVLSHMTLGFPSERLHVFADYIREHYGSYNVTCDDYEALIDDMRQDKKNSSPDEINFTLLSDIGQPQINMTATPGQIGAALDIYRDLMHLA